MAVSVINVKAAPYSAAGNGTLDDTARIQAALNAAATDQAIVFFPAGTYRTTGLTMPAYVKLIGRNATLKLLPGTNRIVLTHNPGTNLGVSDYSLVQGIKLSGASSSISSGTGGINSTSPSLILRDVHATWLEAGFVISQAQFGSAFRCKATACTIGLYLKAPIAGGGNSWSFYDFQAIDNIVGVLLNNVSIYPHTSNYFRNPSLLGNDLCGLAAFNTLNFWVDGGANEANGSAGTTLVYDGCTIKKSSFHLDNARMHLSNFTMQEALANPCIIAENSSILTMREVDGYGQVAGRLVAADSTSRVNIDGQFAAQGVTENVVSVSGAFDQNAGAIMGPPVVYPTTTVPNEAVDPQFPSFADTTGAISSGLGQDTTVGEYRYVEYAASVGSPDGNRIRINQATSAGIAVMSFLAYSNVATTLTVGVYGTSSFQQYRLPATTWMRVIWIYTGVTAATQAVVLYPAGSEGATVRVAKMHVRSGSDTPALRAHLNAIISGAYNPNIKALKPHYETTSSPASGTWAVGDVVWNSTPSAGGALGWVCTTAGTWGVWKPIPVGGLSGAYTQTYSTADKTLSAYTPDTESVVYTGAADSEAKLVDLNALRVAYENLRAFTEDLAGFVNSLVDDLQARGDIS